MSPFIYFSKDDATNKARPYGKDEDRDITNVEQSDPTGKYWQLENPDYESPSVGTYKSYL